MLNFEDVSTAQTENRKTKHFEPVSTIGRGTIRQLAFTPKEQLLAIGGRGIDEYNPENLEITGRFLSHLSIDRLDVGGGSFVFQATDGDERQLWRWNYGDENAELVTTFQRPGMCEFDATSTHVAIPTGLGISVLTHAGEPVKEFELDDEERSRVQTSMAALSADGKFALTCVSSRILAVWNLETGERVIDLRSWDAPNSAKFVGDKILFDGRGDYKVVSIDDVENPVRGRFEGGLFFGDDRCVSVGRFGGYQEVDFATLTLGETVDGFEKHYGRLPETIGAVSKNYVAAVAGSFGALLVHSKGSSVTKFGFLMHVGTLSVSDDGSRIVMLSEFRDAAHLIDREDDSWRTVSHTEGLIAPAISRDGETLILPTGNNLKPRATMTIPFGGDGEPVAGPKLMPFVRKTETFGEQYACNAYNLSDNGFVGIYKVGKSRAVMKIKGDARLFDISSEGNLLIAARKGEVTVHDLTAKGKQIDRREGHVMAVAIRSDGMIAIAVREDDEPKLIIKQGDHETKIDIVDQRYGRSSATLKFSQDGSELYLGATNGVLYVFDPSNGELLKQLSVHAGGFEQLTIANGSLWSLGADCFIYELPLGQSGSVSVSDLDEGEEEMAPTKAWKQAYAVPALEPENGDAESVEPFPTDWAKTQFPVFVKNLEAGGFVRNPYSAHASIAMDLYAPGIGIAVVDIDEEHGCSRVSFHRWDGTMNGAGVMKLSEVDPDFYAFAYYAVRDAYSDDL